MNRKGWKYPIVFFSLAQVACFTLLALWIYWFVSNYFVFSEVEETFALHLSLTVRSFIALIGGIVLLASIIIFLSLIFVRWDQQVQANSRYDTFIANVTHELKTPLASVQLYLETMENNNVPEEKRKEFYRFMQQDTERLNQLITSILEIAKVEGRKGVFHFNTYQLDELIRKLLRETAEDLRLPPSTLTIRGNSGCICKAAPEALQMVFSHLISNAVKYTIQNPEIFITLGRSGRRAVIEIQDSGIGIPKRYRKLVFKKFRRVERNDSPSVKGTGLGLYLVKELIRLHNGTISIENSDEGTLFRIEIPAKKTGVKADGTSES